VVAGKTNRSIAQDLHVSLTTVKRHLERLTSRLRISDRTRAAVKATEMGLLPTPEDH
jgi:DNA-binding NarL/FixJ family response regulator